MLFLLIKIHRVKKVLTNFKIRVKAIFVNYISFYPYKNKYKDKDIVLLGAGPTLNQFKPIDKAIYIGTNRTFKLEKIKLDYLFIQDNLIENDDQTKADLYKGNNCQKFYGYHYLTVPITKESAKRAKAKRYIFLDRKKPILSKEFGNKSILFRPLNTWASVIFPALEFALWTNPKKIYIVGCDCTDIEHFDNTESKLNNERILYGWLKFKEFAKKYYPNTEIISINPKGLIGLFKDISTSN